LANEGGIHQKEKLKTGKREGELVYKKCSLLDGTSGCIGKGAVLDTRNKD